MCTGAEPEVAAATEGAKGAGEVAAADVGGDLAAGTAQQTGAASGSGVLTTIKTLAPAVSAGASLIGAGAALSQAQAAKSALVPKASGVDTPQVQAPVDPDLTTIRKRNALLFGLDSPGSTDVTKGKADVGNIGKATLLGQ